MKKTFLVLAGAAIATGAIIALQSYATTTPSLPTRNEISALKSSNNQNRLSAQMRDKMLDLLGGIRSKIATLETKTNTLETKTNNTTPTVTEWCIGRSFSHEEETVGGDRRTACNPQNIHKNLRYYMDGGEFNIGTHRYEQTFDNLARKSTKLGKHTFCALSIVAYKSYYDNNREESIAESESICYVFKHKDNRYLYGTTQRGHNFCQATCF